jgi:hypothetical protein
LVEPSIVVKLGLGTVDVVVGFSEMILVKEKYDGNTLLSTSTTTITSNDKTDSLDLALYLKIGKHGHLYLKDINIASVETSTCYEESGITNYTGLSGFDRLETSLSSEGILAISSHIDKMVTERYLLDVLQSKDAIEDIDWSIAVDLPVLFQILYAEISDGTKPDASELIGAIDITAETGTLENCVKGTVKNISDISIVLNRASSSQYRLDIQWKDDEASYEITSSNMVLNSFGLSSTFLMDLDVSIPSITAEIMPFSGPASEIAVTDLELVISNMDLAGLYGIHSRLGTMDVQQLLDNCECFHLSASGIAYAKNGHDMVVSGLDAVLEEDARRQNTLSVSVDSVEGSMELNNGGILVADVEGTTVYFSTNGSLAEYFEIMNSVPGITTNSEMVLQVKTYGVDIDYAGSDRSLTVSSEQISPGASGMELDLFIRHTLYKDSTLLNGSVSASGYELTLKEYDYEKKMYLDAVLTDAVASIDDMNIGELAVLRYDGGKIGATEILDNTDRMVVQVGSAVVDYGETHVEFESMDLRVESSGRHVAMIESGSFVADIPVDGKSIELEADSADIFLSSDASFTDLQKASVNGFEFESDVSIDFTADLTGLNVNYASENLSVDVSGSGTVEAELSFDNSVRWDKSVLSARLSAIGYKITAAGNDKDGKAFDVAVTNPEVDLDDVDIAALLSLYDAGTLEPTDILDNTKEIAVKAALADVKYDKYALVLGTVDLRAAASYRYAVDVGISSMEAHVPTDLGSVDMESGAISVSVESDISFSDLQKLAQNSLEFESDAEISLEASVEGLSGTYGDGTAIVSSSSGAYITLSASVSHSEKKDETLMDASISAPGYTITLVMNVPESGDMLEATAVDPVIALEDVNVSNILAKYDSGDIGPVDLLDSAKRAAVTISSVDAEFGEHLVKLESLDLRTEASSRYTVTAKADYVDVSLPYDGKSIGLKSGLLYVHAISDTSFTELQSVFANGLDFQSDAIISLDADIAGLSLTYEDGTGASSSMQIDIASEDSSVISMEASLVHSMRTSKTFLDADISATGYTVTIDGDMGYPAKHVHAVAVDPGASVEKADVDKMMSAYNEKGKLEAANILDNVAAIALSAASVDAEYDAYHFIVNNLGLGIGSANRFTATVSASSLIAQAPSDIGNLDIRSGALYASIDSSAPFTELMALVDSGLEFESDVKVTIDAMLNGLDVGMDGGSSDSPISGIAISGSESSVLFLEATIDHSERLMRTTLDASVSGVGYKISVDGTDKGGKDIHAAIFDPELTMNDLDLDKILSIYEDNDKIEAADLLDNVKRIEVGTYSIEVEYGEYRFEADSLKVELSSANRYYASVGTDFLSAYIPIDNGTVISKADGTEANLISDIPFSGLMNLVNNGFEFQSDTDLDLDAGFKGLDLQFENDSISLDVVPADSGYKMPLLILGASLEHSERWGETSLSASLYAPGYTITINGIDKDGKAIDAVVADPEVIIDNADFAALSSITDSKGEIGVIDVLDNTDGTAIKAASVHARYADYVFDVESLDARTTSSGRYSVSVETGDLSVYITSDNGTVDVKSADVSLSFVSNTSFIELQQLVNNDFEFDSDMEMGFEAILTGANIVYSDDSTSVTVVEINPHSSKRSVIVADLSLDHLERWSDTFLNASVSAPGYEVTYKGADKDGKAIFAKIGEPEATLENVDLEKLMSIRDEIGTIGIADALDNIETIILMAAYIDADYADSELSFEALNVRTSSFSRYVLAVDYDVMSVHVPSDNGTLDARSGTSSINLVSDTSFNEIMDAIDNNLEFESDVDMILGAKFTGLKVTYSGGPSDIVVTYSDSGPVAPTVVVTASLIHSEGEAETLVDLTLDVVGYGMTVKVDDIGNGTGLDLVVEDPHLSVVAADIAAILSAYEEDGTVSAGLLDRCESIGVSASHMSVKMDEGEKLAMHMTSPALEAGADKKSTVHVESQSISVSAPVQDGEIELEAVGLSADLSSTTTFSELIDIISNLKFDSDAEIGLDASMCDASMTYSGEAISFSLTETDDTGSPEISLYANLVHTEDTSGTLLSFDASTVGYTLVFDSHGLHYGKVPVKGDDLHAMSVDPGLSIGDLNIAELLDLYEKNKSLELQQLLDNCGSLLLSTDYAEVEWDGDGEIDAFVVNSSAGLSRNSSGHAAVAFEMEEAKVAVPIYGMIVDLHANETKTTISSDIPFSDLTELILGGMEFTEDTNMDISLSSKGLGLCLDKDGASYRLSLVPREETLSNPFTLDLDLSYILYNDRSTLSGKLDTSGYTATIEVDMDEETSRKVLSLPFSSDVGTSLKFVLEDLVFDMSGFDIKTVYDIIAETETITIQQLIDSSNSLGMSVASISADIDSDDAYDATLSNVKASLSKSILGLNTMSFGFEELTTTIELEKGTVDVHSDASEVVVITEGSITECIDAFFYGEDFSEETRAEIHLSNESLLVEYKNGEDYLSISNEKMSDTSPKYVTVVLSMEHSDYKNMTYLDGKLSAIGHSIVLYDKSVVNDDGGIIYLTLKTDEASGGFEADFGEDVALSANLYLPWNLDFSYYDVEFRIESSDSVTSLTHGKLNVDGYDHEKEGLLAILPAILDSDFTYETRVLLSSGDMSVYGNDGTTVLSSYGNTEIGIKKLLVDLKRGDVLNVTLEKVDLSITDQDGKVTEKSLDRLDVTKDVSGVEPEEGWVEKNSLLLAILFFAAAAVMLGYLVRYYLKKSRGSDPEDSEPKE